MVFKLQVRSEVTRYRMFVPLVEGFAGGAAMATNGDVADCFELWLKARGASNRPYFTGLTGGGEASDKLGRPVPDLIGVFGWHDADTFVTIQEANSAVEFSTHPELHAGLNDSDFEEMLQSLASFMGEMFRQKRIYIMNLTVSELLIFQEEGSRTPTQIVD